ncbi:MAG: hypothetical protein IPG04_26855 [Polyangiaceae bacterium]|nr:hypothetical protein [Polyangiaceae bacterium]
MTKRDRAGQSVGVGLVLVALATACGDDSTATGGSGASGGSGGTAPGGAPGTGGDGGAGGAPAACTPYEPTTCDAGSACVVVDDVLGLDGGTACAAPGAGVTFSQCAADTDCAAATLCDRVTSTCKPLCDTAADCGDEGACVSARTAAGAEIPGLKLCLAGCDPVANAPCADAGSEVGCLYRGDEEAFDCAVAGDTPELTQCSEQAECDSGLGCLEVNGQLGCLHWCVYDGGTDLCTSAEHPTSSFAICVPQSPTLSVGGVVYGGCLPQ